jgi:Ser/Thr protein kinase RdoA (MazF antagonist)
MHAFDAALLDHYPAAYHGSAAAHNAAAFSGAEVWRLQTAAGMLCARAWPKDGIDEPRLRFIHALLGKAGQLDFVPRLISTSDGASWVQRRGRYWELTTWLPGRADFPESPSVPRLQAACVALARLHLAWADGADSDVCPAVLRRLTAEYQWQRLVAGGWRPACAEGGPLAPWAQRAWAEVQARGAEVTRRLASYLERRVPLQPCLCDVWHAHVLYTGPLVTGIVDYGSAKIDHVAVDLARLLGSLAGDNAELRRAGLDAYAELRPLAAWERALIDDLDATGTIVAAMNWLRWLYHEGRSYPDPARVVERLAALVQRLEARGPYV